MQDWIRTQLETGLPAFAGTAISGTVALRQDLLNELLQQWLTQTGSRTTPTLDPERLKAYVKSAAVRAEPGTVLVDFTIAI